MKLCDYGCGQEAKFPFKNGKWCCSKSFNSCPVKLKKMKEIFKDPNSIFNSIEYKKKQSKRMKEEYKDPNSIYNSISLKEKKSNKMKEIHKDPNSKFNSIECKEKRKLDIKKIKKKYPLFSKIEKIKYNPNKLKEKEIQAHCKNHNCKNSKEKGGWFTPTRAQLFERIKAVEKDYGNGGSYIYCSQHCKDTCSLFNLHGDPFKNNNLPYTYAEYKVCRAVVFERENTLCEYCGEPATDMHHIFSVKLEPFFALDPDYCVACCEKHHYKYAHKDECSTGNLAKIVCSVESQKFLNQKI